MKITVIRIILLLILFCPIAPQAAEVFYYSTDNVGTPVVMWDKNGKKVWEGEYYPFGEEYRISESTKKNDKRFIGKEKDKETGLTSIGSRYYDEGSGRFVSPDPLRPVDAFTSMINYEMLENPQRMNRYTYGLNNPYRYIDPDGLSPKDKDGDGRHDALEKRAGEHTNLRQQDINVHQIGDWGPNLIAGSNGSGLSATKGLKNASGNIVDAAGAARTQPYQRQVTDHANLRLKTRDKRVTSKALETAITHGQRNFNSTTGKTVHNLPASQSPTGRGVTAVTNHRGGVITVIDKGQKFNP